MKDDFCSVGLLASSSRRTRATPGPMDKISTRDGANVAHFDRLEVLARRHPARGPGRVDGRGGDAAATRRRRCGDVAAASSWRNESRAGLGTGCGVCRCRARAGSSRGGSRRRALFCALPFDRYAVFRSRRRRRRSRRNWLPNQQVFVSSARPITRALEPSLSYQRPHSNRIYTDGADGAPLAHTSLRLAGDELYRERRFVAVAPGQLDVRIVEMKHQVATVVVGNIATLALLALAGPPARVQNRSRRRRGDGARSVPGTGRDRRRGRGGLP